MFGICIFLYSDIFIMRKKTPLELYIFWKEFQEEFNNVMESKVGWQVEEIWILKFYNFLALKIKI